MEGRRWACHAIIAFRQHRRSDDVGRGMPSPPLDSTNGRMTSSMACHNRPWTAHTVGRRRVWYEINALGLHAWSDYGRHGMTSPPLDSTHDRMMFGRACHHCLWAAHTVDRRRAWHEITASGQHTRSNDVGRDMPSPPLGSTHDRMTSGVACHHIAWTANTVD